MNFFLKNKTFFLTFLMLLFFVSCDKDNPVKVEENNGVLLEMSNDVGGKLVSPLGAELFVPIDAIGKKEDDSPGKISFSIEPIKQQDLPLSIPSNYSIIGELFKFSPSSFVFSRPLMVYLPGSSLEDLEDINIIRLDEQKNQWTIIPISDVNGTKKIIGVATFELGYFALVKNNSITKKITHGIQSESRKCGGIKMEPKNNTYYYTLRIVNFTAKFSEDNNFDIVGKTASSGIESATGNPRALYMVGLPQGTYSVEISRIKRGISGNLEYYPNLIEVVVNQPLEYNYSWTADDWTGWKVISEPADWIVGTPPNWPKADVPFGTGEFQATLTWVNTNEKGTDLDLYLYCPNKDIVYFGTEGNLDNSIVLDRDWLEEPGYATENIYSTKSIAKGTYEVKVECFNGYTPKNFEVRIIIRGKTVKTFRGTATKIDEPMLIHKFTI